MSLSLVAVFIPLLFMGGLVGRVFKEFAVTLAVAVAVSLLISLTVTPMLCAVFLRKRPPRTRRGSEESGGYFARLRAGYDRSLGWALRHTGATVTSCCSLSLSTCICCRSCRKGSSRSRTTA
jgi:multidrug efflux pump subunit AcrB